MKVGAAFVHVYVCNITYPKSVRSHRNVVSDEVLVLMEAVVRVGRVSRAWTFQGQSEGIQYVVERVPAGNPSLGMYALCHEP